jgi:hypothetical protein
MAHGPRARGPAFAWPAVLCLLLSACRDPRRADEPPRGASATPPSALDAGVAEAGAAEDPRAAGIAVFYEAARSNLERPFPAGRPGADDFYYQAGLVIGAQVTLGMPAAWNVALVLGVEDDPRAREALVAWAAMPGARPFLTYVVQGMAAHPDEAYLATVRAILDDPSLAGELSGGMALGPSFGGALRRLARVSLYAQTLDLAAALPGGAGRDLVARIAADHTGDVPNPKTLAAYTCPKGEVRVEGEARALASVRLMALAALEDREKWREVASDASETAFIRSWAGRMARGRDDSAATSADVLPCRSTR